MRAEDTLQYMADFYSEIFPTRKHALNHLFCVVGNGYEWVGGELVEEDSYTKRYKLRKPIKKAIFEYEEHWNEMNRFYSEVNREKGIAIPPKFQFRWSECHKEYSNIFTHPDNIKEDWKALLEECIQLMEQDGITYDIEKADSIKE